MTIRPEFFLYLLVMGGVTYLVRLLPMLIVRKKITNKFVRSFLYYVPYAVLATMTFPTIFFATDHLVSGIVAAAVCVLLAYFKRGLVTVAAGGAASVLIIELIFKFLV